MITRLPDHSITRFTLVAIGITLVALARGLPPQTFFVGDPGVKLIAARNALNHPSRPFDIPLPEIGGEPVPYVDPFFALHGTHTHAVTPELFPLLSAPFIAAFGLRGAYVLPAAGLLLALAASAWLARALDPRRSGVLVVLTVFLATPLLFYGLEFWEHALAAGIATLATALFVSNGRRGRARLGPEGGGKLRPYDIRAGFAGLLFGLAALLRPEALWFAVAVLASSRLLPSPPRLSAVALTLAGIALALLPLELYTLLHFGSLVPPHIAGNPAILSRDWLSIRADVIASWFGANWLTSFWRVAPASLLAFLPFVVANFFSTGAGARLRSHSLQGELRRAGPLGAEAQEREGGASEHSRGRVQGRSFLFCVAALDIALVVLTAPNDGGGQWGPRYLLLAYIPLAILVADIVTSLVTHVGSGFSRILAVGLAIVVALGSAWIQRAAYKELRSAKMTYARLVDFVGREVPPGGYAVTDLWWLDQVAAVLTDSRVILYVADERAARDALQRLDSRASNDVWLIQSAVESSTPFDSWISNTCYVPESDTKIPERTVHLIHVARSCR